MLENGMAIMKALIVAIQLACTVQAVSTSAKHLGSYDYVIVGGGVTGLVVANRLSEDSNVSVLVLESGESVDSDGTMILYKSNDFTGFDGLLWDDLATLPEPALANSTFSVSVAKVLGGGSVVNGMIYDRGSAADYDAWEALGNQGWGWDGVLPYFKKGTTFQPPSPAVAESFNITWDLEAYGDGPLTVSITDTQYLDIKDYWSAWKASDVHVPIDGNNGEAYGPSWFPNTMDKTTGRRAHARYAYIDPISNRTNLKILTRCTVTQILFDESTQPVLASGVRFMNDATNETFAVNATQEVMLAAGAIQTPKLLQLSGIGPKSILEAAGVKVKVELDAVGSNFQDHPYATVIFNTTSDTFPGPNSLMTNATYNATAWAEYEVNKTGPYTYARGNALAFIPLPDMTSNVSSIIDGLKSQDSTQFLPSLYTSNNKLLKGFKAQKAIITELFQRHDAAVAESPVPADGTYGLVGIEKPLSRGTIHINVADPSGPPDISYNAFVNPIDRTILEIGLRFFRKVWARPELDKFSISETVPGAQYITDEEIFDALLAQSSLSPTLAHASGSCPMMPEDIGGCVSDKLLVYGTQRLSIVDVSIIPIIPSQHLQATAYMIGEKAADIIKWRSK